jgi:hypothetical protein
LDPKKPHTSLGTDGRLVCIDDTNYNIVEDCLDEPIVMLKQVSVEQVAHETDTESQASEESVEEPVATVSEPVIALKEMAPEKPIETLLKPKTVNTKGRKPKK